MLANYSLGMVGGSSFSALAMSVEKWGQKIISGLGKARFLGIFFY